ncbi:MAG: glutaredoxin domain-containing protein [Nevskiales bacterium]
MQARTSLICLLAVAGISVCGYASAEIYKWTDKDGRVHYSDRPAGQGSSERVHIETVPAGGGDSPAVEDAVTTLSGETKPALESQPLDVVMYATKTCGYCRKARAFLTQRGINWNEIDIESSEQAKNEFKSRGGKGVPLIFINGQPVRGFDEARWQSVFSRYGY